ncbi:aldehyde dehydrogenase family protein [Saccharothrix algeriensis]|uniref:Aldehyde dehydrogenase n=1 Tax=Saccharothrix algeriensis TaxID=173560 RepID=A0A8T8HTS7_9PSEU|nr:aldehyde dehydrogenase family protein [Saccharothrix algeriensis]MBM7813191.1 aldehyde dehydrogenase (NAD+) [Saccharothrix algeriensis]QTR01769.1 aldehyde dehydrogenase family protein [Saccharothrix algeriensis]
MTQTAPGTPPRADDGQRRFASLDPRTGEVVAHHPVHGAAEVRAAVAAGRAAAAFWAGLGFDGRRRRLDAWRRLLVRRLPEFQALISAETGKSADDARTELALVVDHLRWAARQAPRVLGRRRVRSGLLMYNHAASLEYRPLGVVGVIGPWNYPAFTPMGSIAYALAAGNTVVFKPSEHTPGVGVFLAGTFAEVVPEHPVLQAVTGFGETGAALCAAGVDKLAFTGSTATGRAVMAACAATLTPVLLECGGKDALIVAEDADVAAAARGAVWGGLFNAGQTCAGVERVYAADAVYDEFVRLVADKARALRPGGDPDADFGPITTPEQVEVIRSHVADALERGGRAVVGGAESVRPPYVGPVVLVDVPEDAAAATEETFGPVLVVTRVADADEAVRRANALPYGLGAAVFSRDRGEELAARLRCGMVSVNSVLAYASVPGLPFGGVGDSGFGRVHGEDGLREFTYAHAVARKRFKALLDPMTYERGSRTIKRVLRLVRVLHGR